MAFKVIQFEKDGLSVTEIRDTAKDSAIHILPASGALWHGWWINHQGSPRNLINGYENGQDVRQHLRVSHKSAKLSPFACRIPQGKYSYQGKEYEFVNKFSDGSAIHGLLVDKPFGEVSIDEQHDHGAVSLQYEYRHDDGGYPFDYDCRVKYTLAEDGKVTIDTRIKNVCSEDIPVVDGWHPYFTTGSQVDDCLLQFYANQLVEFDEHLIPTGKLLPYDAFWQEKKIGQTELDHSFLLDQRAPQPRCSFSDPASNITIRVYPTESYPVLQLYIPPDRQSLAIETLSGAPNAFNNGIGLILLSPGEEKLFSATYEAVSGS